MANRKRTKGQTMIYITQRIQQKQKIELHKSHSKWGVFKMYYPNQEIATE